MTAYRAGLPERPAFESGLPLLEETCTSDAERTALAKAAERARLFWPKERA